MVPVTDATVYYDHPVHAMAEHTLNIDITDPSGGPRARVAVELTADIGPASWWRRSTMRSPPRRPELTGRAQPRAHG